MAAKLYYSAGDPDYLKVVVLCEVLGVTTLPFTAIAGVPEDKPDKEQQQILVLTSGEKLLSTSEICKYICRECADNCLIGATPEEQALTDQWLNWEATQLRFAVKKSVLGVEDSEVKASLSKLETHLTEQKAYIIKELSLADIVTWCTLYILLAPEGGMLGASQQNFPLINKWFTSLAQRGQFLTAVQKATNSAGFVAVRDFMLRKTSQATSKLLEPDDKVAELREPNAKEVQAEVHNPDAISPAEVQAAKAVWTQGSASITQPTRKHHPILPIPGKRNILVTSALPYVNNVPHLGNIIGCVLSGDVFARYCRLRDYNTLYICGTDEYGTATETKALEEGLTPQEICRKYFDIHSHIYDWFNINFDYFGRTTTPQQTEIAQDIFLRLHERDFIRKESVDQLHCQQCDRFLADRFVEGTCPICGYEEARGDQCDKCGKLINAIELKSPRCKVCSSEPQVKTSKHLFLDLTKLQPTVTDWFHESSREGNWSSNSQVITSTWLRDGLKPRCITRDLKWGTAVPLDGYTNKVFYVWFDAPIGYLSITACYTEHWEQWWKNPKEVQLYQFMAKDNVPFHTVVFPCSLLGAEDNYTLLNHISATEYLNYEDGKFSKSRGLGVFGNDAQDTGIPADIYRFYLCFIRPETQDTAFSWSDFVVKNNTELLNNLGNFINRVLVFLKKNFHSTIPEMSPTEDDFQLVARVAKELQGYIGCLEKVKIRDGLRHILNISRLGNGHIQGSQPWHLIKGSSKDIARAGSLMGLHANIVCLLSVMLSPYMPQVSQQIQEQLQAPPTCNVLLESFVPFILPGHKIGEPQPLFSKIDDSFAEHLREKFGGMQQASKTPRKAHLEQQKKQDVKA